MKIYKNIASVFVFLTIAALSFSQDSPEEMKSKADALFEKEQYVEATSLYLRIISLDPRNTDFNFKYGSCLLYNSDNKKDALKYLKFSITDVEIDSRAYFFYGRALHLDYQFEEARKQYEKYKNKVGDSDNRYNVSRAIAMCNNGKNLLTTFTDIIVAEKKEIAESRFFDIYSDSKTIGGTILVSQQFQSKLDKKKGHVPIIHFPQNAKAIYYSSYGDDLSTGKDIYISRKLPNGDWGESQLLPGGVNTNEDEDFPYMHPSGNFLYFSSRGHNSMGGYDVFMSRLNHETGAYNNPENVDFAISSPDDDLFYVVDSLFQNAYFASARQSEAGKLHVYRVKVARVPIQEIIIMGEFISEVDPNLHDANVTLITHSNGKELDAIKTNKKGKYSYVFPQGGKYDYVIKINGNEDEYKFTVELPFLDEFKPLKQQIVHTKNDNGDEIITIKNFFDEKVEGAEAIVAQIIRKKAELNVNVNDFNLDEIEAEKKREEVLTSLGFKGMSLDEVQGQLEVLRLDVISNNEIANRIEANLGEEILIKSERIVELDKIEAELTKKANESNDPTLKYKLLNEAKLKQDEKLLLIAHVKDLKDLSEFVDEELSGESNGNSREIIDLERQFKKFADGDDKEGAIELLVENKDVIDAVKAVTPTGILDGYVEKSIDIRKEIREKRDSKQIYDQSETQLKDRIRTLELQRSGAKKKELEKIDSEIDSKKAELEMVEDGIKSINKQIRDLEIELEKTEKQIASFQNAMETEHVAEVDPTKLEEAEAEVLKITDIEPTNIVEEIERLEIEHPEVAGAPPIVDYQAEIKGGNELEEKRILDDPALTEIEQTYRLIENNQGTIKEVKERIDKIDEILETESDPKLEEEKEKLKEFEAELEQENEEYETKAELLKESNPDVALSPDDVIKEIAPTYKEEIKEISSNEGLTPEEKLQATLISQKKLEGSVKEELEKVEAELNENPDDQEVLGRKDILEEILTTVAEDIEKTESKLKEIPTVVASTKPTKEEIITSVAPTFGTKVEEIENDPNLTPLDKEKAIQAEEVKLLDGLVDEKKDLEKKVKKSPEDTEAKERLEAITKIEEETEASIAVRTEKIETLEAGAPVVASTEPTKEEIITSVAPTFGTRVEEIENDPNLTPLDKEKAIQAEEVKLLEGLGDEKKALEKKIKKSPEDSEAKKRLEVIANIEEETEASVAVRAEKIETLEGGTPTIAVTDKGELIKDLDPTYQSTKEEIETSSDSPFKKKLRKATIEAGLLERLKEEKKVLIKEISKNPDNSEAIEKVKVITQMIAEQESILDEIKAEGLEGITQEEKDAIIFDVDPTYSEEIAAATSPEEIIVREKELQEKLEEEIAGKEKQQKRKYSVRIDLELGAFKKLLDESKTRETQSIENPIIDVVDVNPERKIDFVEGLRGDLVEGNPEVVTAEYTTKEDLERQVEVLTKYEEALDDKITEVEAEIKKTSPSDPELNGLQEELIWLKDEKAEVVKKRRKGLVSIGELESNVVASTPTSTQDDPEIKTLEIEEAAIVSELDNDMSTTERKRLEKELKDVQERKDEREHELIVEAIDDIKEEGTTMIAKIEATSVNEPDSPVVSKVKTHYENKGEQIDGLVADAEDAQSEEERMYLLNEAKKKREELNQGVQDILVEQEIKSLEEDNGISLSSPEDLKKRKRQFTIGIGELTTEIVAIDKEIKTAKKKEIPGLEKEREALVNERELLEARLEHVEELLKENTGTQSVVSPEAMKQPVTFNEERKIAASDEYEKYHPLAKEALKVELEIRNLEVLLKEERAGIQRMIISGADAGEIEKKADRIKELESEVERLDLDLTQKKYKAEQELPDNPEDAMKMQNIVTRGLKPMKTAVVATALFQLPAAGLAINTESTTANNGTIEIPVGVENPSGLVYRVQVGAFAKPIASTVFKEFNPVSGELIAGTNVTRYMAGFFNNSDDVVQARQDIRGLGYNDAFVVAYCDGERITFGEARNRERAGTCVPKGNNEIMMEVAAKTAEKLGIPVSNEVKDVPEVTYNQAPGAVQAEPIEEMKGLFFTVQVGVFNRPVSDAEIKYMPDIITIRLPNGLIRYSSGKFNSVEEAYPRQEYARKSGIGGAFITAYYNGERISIGNARRLLAENGKSILQSEIEKVKPVDRAVTPADVIRMDSVSVDGVKVAAPMELWEHRVQIVTKKQFDIFPRDVLNRYNAEGSFYYDEKDKRVKSVIYKNADYLPRITNFKDDVDTVYLPVGQLADTKSEIIGVVFRDSVIPGDFMDWMLRCNYRREIFKTKHGAEVRIFGVEEDDLDTMMNNIKLFGIDPKVIIETEDELELEENK